MADPSGLEPTLTDWDLTLLAARWRLQRLTEIDTENFAIQALLKGYDSPTLRELAWHQESWDDINRLFGLALGELGVPLPTVYEATFRVAREIAARIQAGGEPLWSGATEIRRLYFLASFEAREAAILPADFAYYALDDLLDYAWSEELRAELAPEVNEIVLSLLAPLPATPVPSEFSPTLGGATAEPAGGSATPEPPTGDAWRFAFRFNFDVNLHRFFRGGGPSR